MRANPHILFTHAFFLANDEKQLKEKFRPYPPLATLYAAAVVREAGYRVSLFDAVLAASVEEFRTRINAQPCDLLVIYEDDFNFLTKMCLTHVRDACFDMIDTASSLNIPVVVHSADASDRPELYLQRGADYVVTGEGEQTLLELVDALQQSAQLAELPPGVITLQDGSLLSAGKRNNFRDIDHLPFPAWDLVDFEQYRQAWQGQHGHFSINMVSSRGCPYKCNWCAKPIWGQQYVRFRPEYMAEQLSWLKSHVQPEHIWFADDIFGLNKEWLSSFTETIESTGATVPFTIQSRADLVDERTASLLRRAGCEEVWLGVESGSQAILDSMDKDIELWQVRQARRLLQDNGIKVGFFIQLGYSGEDLEDLQQTRDLILQLKPDSIGVSVSYPLPGTRFHEMVAEQLDEKQNWVQSNDLDAFFTATFTSAFYRKVRNQLHGELKAIHTGGNVEYWRSEWQNLTQSAEDYRNVDTVTLLTREAL